MNILLIDDSRAVKAYLSSLLDGRGHNLNWCENGQLGYDYVCENHNSIDLVFLDWEMPVLDGPSALKKIKEEFSDLPVVMMTTKSSFSDIRSVLELGANEYIIKPFTIEVLQEKIDGLKLGVAI